MRPVGSVLGWGAVCAVLTAGWLAITGSACNVYVVTVSPDNSDDSAQLQGGSSHLTVALTSDRYQILSAQAAESPATLRAVVPGGTPPFTYQWFALDPTGQRSEALLGETNTPTTSFAAGGVDGPYQIFCTVTDALAHDDTGDLVILVGTSVGLALTTERLGVVAGGGELGQTIVHLNPQGGVAPYEATWTVTGPDGKVDNSRLEIDDPLAPRFVSNNKVGTYVLTALVLDAAGSESAESIIVVVGQYSGLDVVASRASVLPDGGAEGMARLLATPIGGQEPLAYDWEVIGPDDQPYDDLLWDTTVRSPMFESGDLPGVFLIRCAVTDADGSAAVGSTTVLVGDRIGVDITADRLALWTGRGSGAEAVLSADVRGGRQPITIEWNVTGPDAEEARDNLSATDAAEVTFTAPDRAGTYVVRCTAEDAAGVSAVGALTLSVGGTLGVVVTSEKDSVATGGAALFGTTQVRSHVFGGIAPYAYAWTVTDPAGGSDPARLESTSVADPVFTGALTEGIYTLLCTITDAAGGSAADALNIWVGRPLNVTVTVDRQALADGGGIRGQAQLVTTVHGGVTPHSYEWSVVAPDGIEDPTRLSSATDPQPVFTSASVLGTYQLTLTATDAQNSVFADSVELIVSGTGEEPTGGRLSLDVSTDDQIISPGGGAQGTAVVHALATGGVAPITYTWTVTDPAGNVDDTRLDSTTDPTATFTSAITQGTYRILCTVSDAAGNVFADSVQIEVTDDFRVALSSPVATVGPGEQVTLLVTPIGGVPNFGYEWSCANSSGGVCTGLASVSQTSAGGLSNTWNAPLALDTYRITCRAVDAEGRTFGDSVVITVTNTFFVDLAARENLVAPGAVVTLEADRSGGTANFTYDWSCADSQGNACVGFGTDPQTVADDVTNTWTAPTALDAYRLVCLATDADGQTFTDSVTVTVTDAFFLDVTVSAGLLAPGATVNLTANRTGGSPNFTYDWSCLDSLGGACAGFGADPQTAADDVTNTWTAPTALGTYRISCLAADADGRTFTDSVKLTVADTFLLDLTADVTHLAPGSVANLVADATGGSANFQYVWTARNSAGTLVGTFGGGVADSGTVTQTAQAGDGAVTWTAPMALGTYRITSVATDADGHTFTDSVMISVTDTFHLDVAASQTHLNPSSTAALTVRRLGGTANFTYEWYCRNGAGTLRGTFTTASLGADSGRATQTDNGAQVTNGWQAPAAGAGTLGTYQITLVGTDNNGLTFTDSLEVVVDAPLSLDLSAAQTKIAASANTALAANRTGGETTFTYAWSAQDSTGTAAGTFAVGATGDGAATQAGVADDATNNWTAPAAVSDTYTITCVLTDALGNTFTDSASVVVGLSDAPSLDLTADKVFVNPGDTVNLAGDQTDGTGPFDYTWSATNEAGAAAGTLGAANQNGVAGDTTNTWTAPAAAAGVLGTDRIEVQISDSAGETFRDSVQVVVRSPLSLNLTANDTFAGPSTPISLTADQTGGETTYDYTWTARDSAGTLAGTFTTGSIGAGQATQNGSAGDATNSWSIATLGSYTIAVTVTDNTGQTFTDSVGVVISSLSLFALDVTADKLVIWPGELVNLVGDRTGGAANFNYSWSALDEAGAPAGVLGAASQNGLADDTTNTWTAPSGAGVEETYRIRCTVTDAVGNTFTDTVTVEVSTLALQNFFFAPATADVVSVLGLTDFTAAAENADPGQQVLAGALTSPVHPRNVVITIVEGNANSINGGTARVTGLDARGQSVSEIINIAASAGGGSTNTGVVPFATVTQVDFYDFNGVTIFPFVDKFEIGVGTKFGLTGVLDAATDVRYVSENGTVITAGYTVDATAGQQGITFAGAPDGARNYTVVFRAR
ncbi:MAG: hypothetical protein GY778_14455 [bacterium]|nr:hypothetical protein [bacterium]